MNENLSDGIIVELKGQIIVGLWCVVIMALYIVYDVSFDEDELCILMIYQLRR